MIVTLSAERNHARPNWHLTNKIAKTQKAKIQISPTSSTQHFIGLLLCKQQHWHDHKFMLLDAGRRFAARSPTSSFMPYLFVQDDYVLKRLTCLFDILGGGVAAAMAATAAAAVAVCAVRTSSVHNSLSLTFMLLECSLSPLELYCMKAHTHRVSDVAAKYINHWRSPCNWLIYFHWFDTNSACKYYLLYS